MRCTRILSFYGDEVFPKKIGQRQRTEGRRVFLCPWFLFEKSCTGFYGVVQSFPLPEKCRSGGIGRRKGLKIPRAYKPVPVRSRSPAPRTFLNCLCSFPSFIARDLFRHSSALIDGSMCQPSGRTVCPWNVFSY
jgi:hypothetical protein